MSVVHRRDSEMGDYGTELSWAPRCFTGNTDPWWRYDTPSTRDWTKVTCKRCLKRRPVPRVSRETEERT